MKQLPHVEEFDHREVATLESTDLLLPLLRQPSANAATPSGPRGVVVGELIAIRDHGATPVVTYPGQSGVAAVPARSIVDLDERQIGRPVVLLFESTENANPIVIGVLRERQDSCVKQHSASVDVEADSEQLMVSARKRLVLRCGKASITLTEEGKILIQGTYVSSRSSGVHRIKGGYVQIN